MAEIGTFRCLRCGHEYEDKFIPNVVQERSCPKCGAPLESAV